MSIRIMSAVWDNGPEDQGELLVLLALADYADDHGYCWPSMPNVAAKARMSERNARRIIRKLEASGALLVEENRGRNATNRYRVITPEKKPDAVSGFEKTGHLRQENRTFEARKPDICDTKPDTAMSAEPSITIKEPSENRHCGFDAFWSEVPRKVGKGHAEKAYRTAIKATDHETLMAGIRRYAETVRGKDPQYICHPATWLNGKRWTDEEPARPQSINDQIEAAFNAIDLRNPRLDHSPSPECLPATVQGPRASGPGGGASTHPHDGGRYQQEVAGILAGFRSGRAFD